MAVSWKQNDLSYFDHVSGACCQLFLVKSDEHFHKGVSPFCSYLSFVKSYFNTFMYQNSVLGVVLASQHFGNPLTAVPCAVSSVCHSIFGSVLAGIWRRSTPKQMQGWYSISKLCRCRNKFDFWTLTRTYLSWENITPLDDWLKMLVLKVVVVIHFNEPICQRIIQSNPGW